MTNGAPKFGPLCCNQGWGGGTGEEKVDRIWIRGCWWKSPLIFVENLPWVSPSSCLYCSAFLFHQRTPEKSSVSWQQFYFWRLMRAGTCILEGLCAYLLPVGSPAPHSPFQIRDLRVGFSILFPICLSLFQSVSWKRSHMNLWHWLNFPGSHSSMSRGQSHSFLPCCYAAHVITFGFYI